VLVSSVLHVAGLSLVILVPLLFVTNVLPEVPTMMAFIAEAPAPPPPPPPPPPPRDRAKAKATRPATPVTNPNAAPVEAPREIEPETSTQLAANAAAFEGGVEGGIPGGIAGGIVGGLPEAPPPPPPPPAPPKPVRVGGQIKEPTLVRRVEPSYPALAVAAHVEGTVILEALVDEHGRVQNVRILRSIPLLDRAAVAAVEQWQYNPVILKGRPVPFVLTVVMTFGIPDSNSSSGRY
jgi:protein TonB